MIIHYIDENGTEEKYKYNSVGTGPDNGFVKQAFEALVYIKLGGAVYNS